MAHGWERTRSRERCAAKLPRFATVLFEQSRIKCASHGSRRRSRRCLARNNGLIVRDSAPEPFLHNPCAEVECSAFPFTAHPRKRQVETRPPHVTVRTFAGCDSAVTQQRFSASRSADHKESFFVLATTRRTPLRTQPNQVQERDACRRQPTVVRQRRQAPGPPKSAPVVLVKSRSTAVRSEGAKLRGQRSAAYSG
jgi:hypothetical protein